MLNSLFLHPGFMIAGGLLISLPILIHLINRMRYKRIKWAAMEFLLKSQKRNRRRLIIEQFLLLALRCLLVALTGFLVARFVGDLIGGAIGAQTTQHVVVLDDSPSMGDHEVENAQDHNCLETARKQILAIAKMTSQANAAQEFKVVLLSDLMQSDTCQPIFDKRINTESMGELEKKLQDVEPSAIHVKPVKGFKAARDFINQSKEGKKVLHYVSDFRETDWNGSDQELTNEIDGLLAKGTNVYLVDTAFPLRKDSQPIAPEHPNVAITDLQADSRVASSEGRPVEFTLSIANYGPSELKGVELTVCVDGNKDQGASTILNIPTGTGFKHKFELGLFGKEGYRHVSAHINTDERFGLKADNYRHALVKVEKSVRVLIIDGSYPDHLRENGDTMPVQYALAATRGYKVEVKSVDELDKGNLSQYPSIYLLNVPQIKSPKGLKNLEDYVAQGGRVAIFMGDRVQSKFYNDMLYKQGEGLMPVPLSDKPSEKLTEEERQEMQINGLYKLYLRTQSQEDQKIIEGLVVVKEALKWLMIDQYIPTKPRGSWTNKPGEVEELATLPSRRSLEFYKSSTQDMLKKLPLDDNKYEKFRPALVRFQQMIKQTLTGTFVYKLADDLERFLHAPVDPKESSGPTMADFWNLPEMQNLKNEVEQLRDTVSYGDPLIVVKKYGKGRVVAILTSAGKAWNEWSGGCLAQFTFPIFISDMQKYLTAPSESQSYKVGEPVTELVFDGNHYKAEAERTYSDGLLKTSNTNVPRDTGAPAPDKENIVKSLGVVENNAITFPFTDAKKPGMYRFTLHPKGEGVKDTDVEERAYVFNIDAVGESDLRRAAKDKLEKNVGSKDANQGKMLLIAPDSSLEVFRQRQSDLSESPWLYLLFLVMLIAEQALAVHLSFHLKGNEAQLPAQAVRSQAMTA
jgi:hypothetical protein